MTDFWRQFDDPLRLDAVTARFAENARVPLHVVIKPSFEDHSCYSIVFRPFRRGSDAFLLRGKARIQDEYKRAVDDYQIENCVYEFGIADIPAETANDWLKLLSKVSIELLPEHSIGTDGTGYELNLGNDDFCSTGLKWWCDGPRSWHPLIEAVNRFIEFAESSIYEPTSFELDFAVEVEWRKPEGPSIEELRLLSRIDWYIKDIGIETALERLQGKSSYCVGIYHRDEAIEKKKAINALKLAVKISRTNKK